jgi:aryl-alcohol dehydrogenase-like predicted oxidoreductase
VGDALAEGLAGAMEVVTKLDPLAKLDRGATAGQAQAAARESVLASCVALRTRSLPVLLLHRWAHRAAFDGAIWRELLALRADGLIGRLGASVAAPAEAMAALDDPDVTHLQLPLNVLDRRWEAVGAAARARPEVEVHARSVLLQGLLAAPASAWPALGGVDACALVGALEAAAGALGRAGRADLCLAFVRGLDWVHALVVGADDAAQVAANAALFARQPLDADGRERVRALLPAVPDALVDPSTWS